MSMVLFAPGDVLIARIADDPDFDFERQFPLIENTIRCILKNKAGDR